MDSIQLTWIPCFSFTPIIKINNKCSKWDLIHMEHRVRFRKGRLKVFSINSECTKITYTPAFNQPFQTCRHYFLIIINDKHSNFTTSTKLLLKGVRGKKELTLKTGFSATPISAIHETFSGTDVAGLCETECRTGLGMRLAGQSQQ